MNFLNYKIYTKQLSDLKYLAAVIVICFYSYSGFSQKSSGVLVCFSPVMNVNDLKLKDTIYIFDNENTIKIETLKFYISHIQLFENETLVYSEKESYHLYNLSDSTHNCFELRIGSIKFNRITFNLGIDSATNVFGVIGGDMDPTKGMYWTWQSGYINLKLEGTSNLCTHPKKEFQFHLGGYQYPYNALKTVSLNVGQSEKIEVLVHISQLLKEIDLSKQHHIMSPSSEAVRLSEVFSHCFSIHKK